MKKFISSLAIMAVLPALASCGEDGGIDNLIPPELMEQCGLDCKTVVEANGSVSGIGRLDAFFTAALNFRKQAAVLEADVTGVLREMALALDLDVEADASADDLAVAISTEIDSGFGGAIEGDISLEYEPPRCEVTAQASVQAAARCSAMVDPGSATVECTGGCVIDAQAKASCEGEVRCTGKAPSFECAGSCEGTCQLEAGGVCEGSCEGSCELDGSAACDGECQGSTDDDGNCTGQCDVRAGGTCSGTCTGRCELNVAAECSGRCTGSCTYDPGAATCNGELTCEASAEASVECDGECKGEIIPPTVEGECEASVEAEAKFEAECRPPSVGLKYELSAAFEGQGNANARLELETKLRGFARAYGKLAAKTAKLELVIDAGAGLAGAAEGAVSGAAEDLVARGDIQVAIGAACAVDAIGPTRTMLADAGASLSASADAVGKVSGSLGG